MNIPDLHEEITRLHANMCSALADPNRILLLYALKDGPHCVNDLAAELGISQPTTSRHLKIMRESSLVQPVRQGVTVEYSLVDPRLIEALDLLRAVLRDRIAYRAGLIHAETSARPESGLETA